MPGKKKLSQEEMKAAEDADVFSEGDISNDSEGKRRRRCKRGAKDADQRKKLISDEYVPNSLKKLRACLFCRLILSPDQWKKYEACPNCPDSRGFKDTTDCYESVVSLILPRKSWVAEWEKMDKRIPGLYALAISAQAHQDALDYDDSDYN